MNPTRGDLQAASGGRRKVPLVPLLVRTTEIPALLSGQRRTAADLIRSAVACGDYRPDLWLIHDHIQALMDAQAGTALGFNVNREVIGH